MNTIEIFQKIDVYIFSLLLLFLIAIKSLNNVSRKTLQSRAFSSLIILTGIIILADCITVFFDGISGSFIRILLIHSSIMGFSLQILIVLYWFWYVQTVLFPNKKYSFVTLLLQAVPAIICIAIAIFSYWTGWLFTFDTQNVYHRGNLFSVIIITTLLYLLTGYGRILISRKNLEKRYLRALISFVFPPIIGGTIQSLAYGTTLLWPSMTISILIIYLAIQNELLLLDYITSLNNRRSFDQALARRIHTATAEKPFALFLIDITNMTSIQDRLGHAEGDRLLTNFATQLKAYFRSAVCVARYNDTIFAVIINLNSINDLYKIKED
ncbi:MAG TPA: GGDEF domain-containing protein, partial [Treponemataceae bacterium]|nr:GGDEF domain-containing protein [Treponemataceae bacterium]